MQCMSEYLKVWCLKSVAQCARRHMLSKKINKKQYIVQIVKPALKYRRCPCKRENFPKHFSCFTQNTIEGILIYTHTDTNNITNLFTYFSICRKLFFIFLHEIYCECRLQDYFRCTDILLLNSKNPYFHVCRKLCVLK